MGRTQGSPAKGGRPAKPPKDVWLYPLRSDWREVLLGRPSAARPRRPSAHVAEPSATGAEERFTRMWQEILSEAVRLASEHAREWIRRRRVLNTLLVVLFVFRLVFAPDRQGYAVTLAELWAQCRPLVRDGYRQPAEAAHYPQGLLSCLFQLRARLPVYDRGYYSFRLQSNANAVFAAFCRRDRRDDIVTVEPSDEARRQSPPVGRHLEGLFLHYAATLDATLREILDSIAPCRQRRRPNRSYPRVSRKPASKWRSRKPTPAATPA